MPNRAGSPVARLSATPASSGTCASACASAQTSASVAWANHGRSVGSGTIRGPAASARCASAMQVGAGSLACTATSAATARTSRGTCAWSAARRMARMREARRGAVAASSIPAPVAIDSSSTRARPRLSASRAAARSMTSIACGDLLATAEDMGEHERGAEAHVVVARRLERLAQVGLALRADPAVASATPSSSRIRGRAPGAGGSARTRRR